MKYRPTGYNLTFDVNLKCRSTFAGIANALKLSTSN